MSRGANLKWDWEWSWNFSEPIQILEATISDQEIFPIMKVNMGFSFSCCPQITKGLPFELLWIYQEVPMSQTPNNDFQNNISLRFLARIYFQLWELCGFPFHVINMLSSNHNSHPRFVKGQVQFTQKRNPNLTKFFFFFNWQPPSFLWQRIKLCNPFQCCQAPIANPFQTFKSYL